VRCEEASEFISVLCDGERIPREVAQHVEQCEACRARLKDYVEMGAELRRLASLESPEVLNVGTWASQQGAAWGWWRKGWQTVRVPRFAFALMLLLIAALGSGLAVLKARPALTGKMLVLMIKAPPGGFGSGRCALPPRVTERPSCTSMMATQSATLGASFRVAAIAGGRFELAVRTKIGAAPVAPGLFGMSFEGFENWPETRHWFEPGEKLDIGIEGFGTITVAGELLDRTLTLDLGPDELRIISPALLRENRLVFDLAHGGSIEGSVEQKGDCILMYSPREGRFILSLEPIEGAIEGEIRQSRIVFTMNGKSHVLFTGGSIARAERVWILHQPNYRPPQEGNTGLDDHPFIGSARLEDLFPKAPSKN